MPDQPLQVVFALVDARRRRDLEAVKELLHPDVVHKGVTADLVCHNRDEVLHNVARSFQRDNNGVDHLELASAGDFVIVGMSGPRFDEAPWAGSQLFIVHTVRDGRIALMRDFLARDEAFRSAGVEPIDWS